MNKKRKRDTNENEESEAGTSNIPLAKMPNAHGLEAVEDLINRLPQGRQPIALYNHVQVHNDNRTISAVTVSGNQGDVDMQNTNINFDAGAAQSSTQDSGYGSGMTSVSDAFGNYFSGQSQSIGSPLKCPLNMPGFWNKKRNWKEFTCPQIRQDQLYRSVENKDDELPVQDTIEIENIFASDRTYVGLHGMVGSGKTTIVEEVVARALMGGVDGIENVIYLKGKDLNAKEVVKFENLTKVPANINITHDTLLVCIDGIDEYNGNLGELESCSSEIRPQHAWICDLLQFKIYPSSKILITSRDTTMLQMNSDLKPKTTIRLYGFRPDAVKKVAKEMLEDQDITEDCKKTTIRHLKPKKSLFSHCSNPLFLDITMKVLPNMLENKKRLPNTISGVMVNLLLQLINNKHVKKANVKPGGPNIVKTVAEITYDKIRADSGDVVFRQDDLEPKGLSIADLTDLTYAKPKKSNSVQLDHIFDGNTELRFVLRLFVEVFAALHVIMMENEDFKLWLDDFERNHTQGELFTWRIVFGILLNDEIKDERQELFKSLSATMFDNENKCDAIFKHLKNRVSETIRSVEEIDLLRVLVECDNKNITEKITTISFSKTPISNDEFYAISGVVSLCQQLNTVHFFECSLNDNHISMLKENIKGTNNGAPAVQIKDLTLKRNRNVVNKDLGAILVYCGVEKLDLYQCQINNKELEDLLSGIKHTTRHNKSARVNEINFATNTEIGCRELGQLMRYLPLKTLDLYQCELNETRLREILEGLLETSTRMGDQLQLTNLKLRRNDDMCYKLVGNIVAVCRVENIDLCYCKLCVNDLKDFADGIIEKNENHFVESMHLCQTGFENCDEHVEPIKNCVRGTIKYGPRFCKDVTCQVLELNINNKKEENTSV